MSKYQHSRDIEGILFIYFIISIIYILILVEAEPDNKNLLLENGKEPKDISTNQLIKASSNNQNPSDEVSLFTKSFPVYFNFFNHSILA